MKEEMPVSRRGFVKTAGLGALSIGMAGNQALAFSSTKTKNKLPQWKGFNLLDFFSPNPANARPNTSEDYFRWMADWGFDFVRIPMAYPAYLDIDRTKNITPDDVYKLDEQAVDNIDRLVTTAHTYNLQVIPNPPRAPGHCVNPGF